MILLRLSKMGMVSNVGPQLQINLLGQLDIARTIVRHLGLSLGASFEHIHPQLEAVMLDLLADPRLLGQVVQLA